MNMNIKKNFLALGQTGILLIGGLTDVAHASGGELWVGFAAMTCVVQNPANEKSPVGKNLLSMPQFQQQFATMSAARECIVRKNLLSSELCSALLQGEPKMSKVQIHELYEKHSTEIQGLQSLSDCETSKH
ncbi:hypothetical protein SAMN04515617_113166 [Collimonas sp. OK242]|jgi:hypothetical protein|uniref:hypothetical protein n=1 Tax=Collimonas sp. OK242 TaxID=1798195 RepID=UPI000897E252|nr:hypothetical protein [Collimonas sp. OK242]SDY38382.1 hypothetical protein SAMN04515617_113166 [Collimonas sp. OK242]